MMYNPNMMYNYPYVMNPCMPMNPNMMKPLPQIQTPGQNPVNQNLMPTQNFNNENNQSMPMNGMGMIPQYMPMNCMGMMPNNVNMGNTMMQVMPLMNSQINASQQMVMQ